MSDKPSFEDFYKSLDNQNGYILDVIYGYYQQYMQVKLDVDEFLELPEIKENFKIMKINQPGLIYNLTVLKKRY